VRDGLRIYNLFPTLAGTIRQWSEHLPRIAAMGFNAVYVNPFHYPGFSGSLYAVKDYYRLNPRFRGEEQQDDATLLRDFTEAAQACRLMAMMDLVINHTSKDSELAAHHPDWFAHDEKGELQSPFAIDPADSRRKTVWGDLAELDYAGPHRQEIVGYFQKVVQHYLDLGFRGFRCDAAYKLPAEVWRALTTEAKNGAADALFCAETVGAPRQTVLGLAGAGFDYLYNSVKWWDFKSPWLLEQYEDFRHIAPSVGFAESHDTPRLVSDLHRAGVPDDEIEPRYRQAYAFAAAYSTGLLMPMGFEYGWERRMPVVEGGAAEAEPKRFDLSLFIAETNAIKLAIPALNEEGPQRLLSAQDDELVVLERQTNNGEDRALIAVNRAASRSRELVIGNGAGAVMVEPLGVRVAHVQKAPDRKAEMPQGWRPDARIQIEEVYPQLDGGRYPVKRIEGETLAVWADVFRDGHDRLRGVVKYRHEQDGWREAPLVFFDNDRWTGQFRLDRLGLWHYTIEIWTDRFESWREEVEKKREAGQAVALELAEARQIIAAAVPEAKPHDGEALQEVLRQFDAGEDAARLELLFSAATRELMARASPRADAVRYAPELEVVVDRKAARFSAWYEMFPRSQGRVAGRSASFDDCIARLPEIAALGFDVVYLPPIHPIGRTNRKGKNNNPQAAPGDPGSPYAIGSEEGGHTTVEPQLGTLADFRRFVRAAAANGMEVALDFAVQCAPDHPWVREHPQWFRFRPDGSIKYAENPPKKYEDIVNVDFDTADREALWNELRDVVLFWVEEGVRIFRVDNPHTKPVPFWEWLIRSVKLRCPEAIFLSEAFTRPKMMQVLAKAGFSQSYTYFTWRNNKSELIEYLTELTQYPVYEYFRPNFFTNTPDILSEFLQHGGRAAFRIRLVLAATLSPSYGIYNGFELCENTPIPGREEYLDSEKYEYKVWDWNRPGNIKDDIRIVNRFRRRNPALQEFLNLRFLPCDEPNILAYAKISGSAANAIVIVNLDPHGLHEADVELPLASLGLSANSEFALEEAFSKTVSIVRGARQRFRLDPETSPALMFRVRASSAA
jgi:starch synthase (maltosyl-transferring)